MIRRIVHHHPLLIPPNILFAVEESGVCARTLVGGTIYVRSTIFWGGRHHQCITVDLHVTHDTARGRTGWVAATHGARSGATEVVAA